MPTQTLSSERPAATDREADLVVRNLVRSYPGGAGVAGLDLVAAKGELISLLGASGCGKTTTLRCIAGIDTPSSGEISIGGEPMWSSMHHTNVPPERRNIGMVFQSYALWPHLTALENVMFPLRARKVPRVEAQRRAQSSLELVGLGNVQDRSPDRLSGGQQQRVALARALVYEPALLLFDEPLSNLDAELRESVRQDIRRIQRELNVTTLYVTHDRSEALALSDRLMIMSEGRVVQVGRPADLLAEPASPFVASLLGSANLLHGTIESAVADNGGAIITIGAGPGEQRRHFTGRARNVQTVGADAVVCVRPTSIRLAAADDAPAGTPVNSGKLRDCYPIGPEFEYIIDYGAGSGHNVKCILGRDLGLARGDEIVFWYDPATATSFEQPASAR